MKKIFILLVLGLFLSGCATYKFLPGKEPYDKGYVVSRENRAIPEYTIGQDNSVPDLKLAKERFKRRKAVVEHYHKKMGYIQNNFTMMFWDPVQFIGGAVKGVFYLPYIIYSDYRYEHDPKYREKISKLEREQDAREKAYIEKLTDELNLYIQKDLAKEESLKK